MRLLFFLLLTSALLAASCLGPRRAAGPAPLGFDPRNRYDHHDRPRGRWRTYYDAARTQPYTVGRYRHGRPVRTFQYFAPTGALEKSEQYGREGYCDVTDWYPSGKVARRGRAQWLTGSQGNRFYWFGPWTSFSEQGDTTALEQYADGKIATRIGFTQGQRAVLETYNQYGKVESSRRLP